MMATYKAIDRPVLDYAAPVWYPAINDTQWTKLQSSQNAALRTATGCQVMSHEDHLHQEAKMLTVRDYCTLLTRQFLLKCEATDHRNHASTRDQPVGRIKQVRTDLRNEKPHIGHLTHLVVNGKTK